MAGQEFKISEFVVSFDGFTFLWFWISVVIAKPYLSDTYLSKPKRDRNKPNPCGTYRRRMEMVNT